MPIQWTLKNCRIFSFTPPPDCVRNNPTYRDGILKEGPTRINVICSSAWKSWRQSTKEENLPKIINGQKPTVPFLAGIEREDGPPHHPTPRRATLSSTRKTMQSIQAMHQPVQKRHACCMALDTLSKSANYLRTNTKSTAHSSHLKTRKPAPTATSVPRPSSLTTRGNSSTPRNIMMNASPKIRREKSRRKTPRVIRPMHNHQRMKKIMTLSAWTWSNLHMTRKMTPNEYSLNVGNTRCHKVTLKSDLQIGRASCRERV